MEGEPLSERTGRYRRNVIVLAFVLSLIGFLEHLDFSNAGFFGVRLDESETKPEFIIIGTIALVFAFQSLMFWVYAIKEYRAWRAKFRDQVPFLRCLYGFRYPKKRLEEYRKDNRQVELTHYGISNDKSFIYEITFISSPPEEKIIDRISLRKDFALQYRGDIHFYASIDLLIPGLLSVIAIYAIITRLWF